MAALPYMQLYVADYLADTAHLNAAQHGAYLLLLMNYWQRGKALRNDNGRLANVARMSNEEWNANREVLEEFFDVTEEEWIHHRVEKDLEGVRSKSEKASAAGRASAERKLNKRSTNVPTNVERTFNHTDTDTDTDTEQRNTLAPSAKPLGAIQAENLALIPNPSPEPPLGTIPLVDKTSFAFTQADVSGWCEAYPGVDVMGELKQMREWSIANPTHRKTKSGIRRFITSWLAKEQDKAGRPQGGFSERTTATQRSMASAAEYLETLRDREGAGGIEYPETGGRVEGDLRRLC